MNTNTYKNWTKEQLIALVDELHLEGSHMDTELKTTKLRLEGEIESGERKNVIISEQIQKMNCLCLHCYIRTNTENEHNV
jgi:predicted AAA+ superfamily ATPase